jgi:hypothetical protein
LFNLTNINFDVNFQGIFVDTYSTHMMQPFPIDHRIIPVVMNTIPLGLWGCCVDGWKYCHPEGRNGLPLEIDSGSWAGIGDKFNESLRFEWSAAESERAAASFDSENADWAHLWHNYHFLHHPGGSDGEWVQYDYDSGNYRADSRRYHSGSRKYHSDSKYHSTDSKMENANVTTPNGPNWNAKRKNDLRQNLRGVAFHPHVREWLHNEANVDNIDTGDRRVWTTAESKAKFTAPGGGTDRLSNRVSNTAAVGSDDNDRIENIRTSPISRMLDVNDRIENMRFRYRTPTSENGDGTSRKWASNEQGKSFRVMRTKIHPSCGVRYSIILNVNE